ncbi:MAG: DUF1080 domain-containing protein, partial [Planctomycetes bacterium]|nr:DUF1080 domain-containing protein [Planctomycetota bacterium]
MFRFLPMTVAFAALALAGPSALADREAAQLFATRAEKSLKAKEWDKAEEYYRRALEEDETFLPARAGLAEALVGGGKQAAGVEELRRLLADAEKGTPDPAWTDLLAKAKKRLDEIDASGRALEKILDAYAAALLALAEKSLKEDPDIAERSLRRILRIRPEDKGATELLKMMGKSTARNAVSLFNGKNFDGWVGLTSPIWQVREGLIVGDVRDSSFTAHSEGFFKGDFDVAVEMKLLETYPGTALFTLLASYRGDYDYVSFGILNGRLMWEDYDKSPDGRVIFRSNPTDLKNPIKPEDWNLFELRFRGDTMVALCNGTEVAREPRPKD